MHFAIVAKQRNLIVRMLQLGADPSVTPRKEDEVTLRQTPPIAFAFQLACTDPELEEFICLMLRSQNYQPSIQHFEEKAKEYFKAHHVKPFRPEFEEILMRLTLLAQDRQVGRVLMSSVDLNEKNDLSIFASAYLKIFGSSEKQDDVNIQVGLRELAACELKAAKILLELNKAQKFSSGMPKNFSELAQEVYLHFEENQKQQQDLKKLADEKPLDYHRRLAQSNVFDSILVLAEAYQTGKFGVEINLHTSSEFFQRALSVDWEQGFPKYEEFVLAQQNSAEVLRSYLEFTCAQKEHRRAQCELVFVKLAFNEEIESLVADLSVTQLFKAKNPKLPSLERWKLLEEFLSNESVSPEVKVGAVAVFEQLSQSAKTLAEQNWVKKVLEQFKTPEIVAALCRESLKLNSLQLFLLSLDTSLSRFGLLDYYESLCRSLSFKALREYLRPPKVSFLNKLEISAVNRILLLNEDYPASLLKFSRTTRSYVKQQCESFLNHPAVKEFYAERLKEGNYFFRQKPEDLRLASQYFYEAACQFLEAYRYLKRDDVVFLQRALRNLKEAASLQRLDAIHLFDKLLKDAEWNHVEKAEIEAYARECLKAPDPSAPEKELRVEDFDPLDESMIRELIWNALSNPQEDVKRRYLEKAAAMNPSCYTQLILNIIQGGDLAAGRQVMLLECAKAALMSQENPKAASEYTAYLGVLDRKLLELRGGASPLPPEASHAYQIPQSLFSGTPAPVEYTPVIGSESVFQTEK